VPTSKGPKCFNKWATDPPGDSNRYSNSGEERVGETVTVTVTVMETVTVTAAETATVAEVKKK
jgi:hypothetical protein